MAKNTVRKERGVYRRTDSTQWQWQLKVPKDLRPLYPSPWAEQCSLRTSKLEEANRKARQLRVQWDATFKQQRDQREQLETTAPEKVECITPQMAKALADAIKHTILDIDERVRTNPKQWAIGGGFKAQMRGMPDHLADTLSETNREQVELLSVAVARNRLDEARPVMENVAAELGLAVDERTPGYAEALRVCLHALKDAYALGMQRDKGEVVETPPAPSLKQIEAQKPRYLRDVFELWKAPFMPEEGKKPPDKVTKKAAALKLYEEQTGNPPLNELRREQGAAFKTYLLKQKGASKTKNMRLGAVKELLKHASQDLEWLPRNPWQGLDIPYVTEKKREPWTLAEVKALFGLALFTEYELPKATASNGGPAAYWIPLLGLYTGASISELCQLQPADVLDKDGIACISINDEAEGKRVKTEQRKREVPLHSELVRLGFLEYVEAVRQAREEWLWPALSFRTDKPGGYFSGWFSRLRKTAPENVPDFHSFRHTVRSKLAEKHFPEALQDRITGHKVTGSAGVRVYTHYTLAVLSEAVEKIEYPGLTLTKVFKAS